jgi:hypothetical protein
MVGLQPQSTSSSLILTPGQERLIQIWEKDPWDFLTGKDEDGTPIYWTKDERDRIHPVKPFPGDLLYLKVYISILADVYEDFVLADKSRQMYLSTGTLGYMVWESIFLPGRRWLLSKSTEDESKEMIKDKIRFPISMLPAWLRNWADVSEEPEARVDFRRQRSYILGVAQNVADREARGGTASGILIDEAAFQDKFQAMVAAALPMAAKIIGITTPNARATAFREYMDDHVIADYMTGERYAVKGIVGDEIAKKVEEKLSRIKKYPQVPGMSVKKTQRGVTVIHLDYWADPAKDAVWAAKIRAKMPGESEWRAEYGRDWDSVPGEAFYREFQTNPGRYVKTLPRLINAPVYRGWDFGRRTPACVWLQFSQRTGRVWVVREILPVGFDIYSFLRLVLYLSGQLDRGALERFPLVLKWLQELEEDPHTPENLRVTPWFTHGPNNPIQFIDHSGHEAQQRGDTVQTKEQTRAQILASEGIYLEAVYTTVKAKTDNFRRLLNNLPDGLPGIFFDPACKLLIKGFSGAITFAKPTPENPIPTEPRKDGIFDNLHEALGYPIVNAVPMVEYIPPPPPVLEGYGSDRQQVWSEPGETTILDADFRVL